VEEYLQQVVYPSYAATHTDASFAGTQTSKYREEGTEAIKKSFNAKADDVLIFAGSGCTAAVDLLYHKLLQFYRDKDVLVVLICSFEHHSKLLPWREGLFELIKMTIAWRGNIDLDVLEALLKKYQSKRPLTGSFSTPHIE
jgi:selenocysteine lyase/cysteine desulfurase